MNILFYCNEYPPYRTGGIGNVTKIVAESLVKRGHNIYIVGYYDQNTELPYYSTINGVHVYRLNLGYRTGKIRLKLFYLLLRLRFTKRIIQTELSYTESFIEEFVKKNDIDIIELTDFYNFNGLSKQPLKFKKFSVPTVLRIHGSISFLNKLAGKENIEFKLNDSLHFKRCDYLSAVSQYSLSYVCENFDISNFKKKLVIYNPLEDSFYKRQSLSSSKKILFIGKLSKNKGCYALLSAFNNIYKKFPDWTLELIGGGNIDAAKKFIDNEAINNVFFKGFCNREEIQKAIDECAFACIPTYFETFGMVATEIMSRSRTLIFTNTTSGPEIIQNNKNGILVNPNDIKQIESSICSLIENRDLLTCLSNQAYQDSYNKFRVNNIIYRLEDLYKSLIEKTIDNI